jgi:protocatechuate 3,4-dioxygenase beta subunit
MVSVDSPAVTSSGAAIAVSGWAIDTQAVSSAGIDSVMLYIWPSDASGNVTAANAAQPLASAAASYGGQRPDIAGTYGGQFLASGFTGQLPVEPAGNYLLAVYAHSNLVDNWGTAQTVIQVLSAAPSVAMAIDSPGSGSVPASFVINGWAIDTTATANTGIDAVHVYIWNSDAAGNVAGGAQSGTQLWFSPAVYGSPRPDVASQDGSQFGLSGFSVQGPALSSGNFLVGVFAHSAINGSWSELSRIIQVGPAGAPQAQVAAGGTLPNGGFTKGILQP